MRTPALKRALDAIGGVSKAAQAIGVTKQAVSSWRFPPAIHVVALSKLSGVPCHELRPDVFHDPAAEAAEVDAA